MHSTRINTRISLQISLNQSHLISIYIPTLPHVFLLFLLTHYTTSSNYHHTHILFISHTRIHGFKEEEGPEGLVISFGFCFTRQQGYKRVVFARGSTGSKESLVGCELILLLVLLFVFLSIKVYYLCLALFLFCSTMICIRKNVTKTKLWIKYILSHKMILRSAWNDDGKKTFSLILFMGCFESVNVGLIFCYPAKTLYMSTLLCFEDFRTGRRVNF